MVEHSVQNFSILVSTQRQYQHTIHEIRWDRRLPLLQLLAESFKSELRVTFG